MAVYTIAELNININNKHKHTDIICEKYLAKDQEPFDFSACSKQSDIEKDRLLVPDATDGYLEALSIYRDISEKILDYDGFVLHSSIIEKNGMAYGFSAKSGTGKTTHSRLWVKTFPDARIINGDKPLVRIIDGKVYVYGTPWCGKENYNINAKAPLTALCFLEQAKENSISVISKAEAVKRIYSQLLVPKSPSKINKLLTLVGDFIDKTPTYLLKCNISEEAVQIAYKAMSEGIKL